MQSEVPSFYSSLPLASLAKKARLGAGRFGSAQWQCFGDAKDVERHDIDGLVQLVQLV